jgi:hypothetical protein
LAQARGRVRLADRVASEPCQWGQADTLGRCARGTAKPSALIDGAINCRLRDEVRPSLIRLAEQLVDVALAVTEVHAPLGLLEQGAGAPHVVQPTDALPERAALNLPICAATAV